MSFPDAVKSAFLRAFDYQGRSSRPEYWWFVLFNAIVTVTLYTGLISSITSENDLGASLFGPLCFLWFCVVAVVGLALSVRRLHDTGRSGHWMWLLLIYGIGALILVVFYCEKTEPQPNAYGPVPSDDPAVHV